MRTFDFSAPSYTERPAEVSGPFEAKTLPLEERRRLCEDLLNEFGVTRVQHAPKRHELIHSCPLPGGAHRNGDRSASASLNYEDLVFRCLGCGAKGGFLWFVATCRKTDGAEARDWLNGATGLGGELLDIDTIMKLIDQAFARPGAPEPIPTYGLRTLDPWLAWEHPYPMLTADPREPAPRGMRGRGIPEQTLLDFKVGYAPDYEMRVGSQLIVQERIIIPHFWSGELVGWQARKVDPHHQPKYKSTPGFPKDRTLYNHARRSRVVVVESPMSVLRHAHHVPELEATFGAAVTESQLRLLRGFDEVVLWFDNDPGGWEGTRQIIEGVKEYADVSVVASDLDADPADLDDQTMAQLLRNAVPWPLWSPPQDLREWEYS